MDGRVAVASAAPIYHPPLLAPSLTDDRRAVTPVPENERRFNKNARYLEFLSNPVRHRYKTFSTVPTGNRDRGTWLLSSAAASSVTGAAVVAGNAMTASAALPVAEGARTAGDGRRRFTCNRGGGKSTGPPSSTVRIRCAWKKTLFTGTYTRRALKTPKSARIFSFFQCAFGKYECRQQSELCIPISPPSLTRSYPVCLQSATPDVNALRRFRPASIALLVND